VTKDPRVYLAHILECVEKVERFTAGGEEAFLQEPLVQDAVLRNLEVIGEAAKRVDDAFRAAHPEVPWRSLAGLRDVLIHQYEGVDVQRVWRIVEGDLPALRSAIDALLPPLEQLEEEIAGEAASAEAGD
jgi:uncharacterized protein with HEPN domain